MNSPRYSVELFSDGMEHKDRSQVCSDLELAAQIGKKLLERNKELEVLLKSSHQYLEEQALKNEFLSKQLQTLRVVNESRVKAYEQLEATALELQTTNNKLQSETANMKRRYGVLSRTIEALEVKCEDYQLEIDELKTERLTLQREVATTFPSSEGEFEDPSAGNQVNIHGHHKDTLESDIEVLNERISNLKAQHSMEKRKREDLESELTDLIQENRQLEDDVEQFARRKWQSEEAKLDKVIDTPSVDKTDSNEMIEDESYVLLEIDPYARPPSPCASVEAKPASTNSASFLSELDSQYHELVYKYDSLLNKCRKEGVLHEFPPICHMQKAIQASTEPEVRSCGQQVSSQQHREYRRLFAEIYSKLEESKNFKCSNNKEATNTTAETNEK